MCLHGKETQSKEYINLRKFYFTEKPLVPVFSSHNNDEKQSPQTLLTKINEAQINFTRK
jgi:hypothetical protein